MGAYSSLIYPAVLVVSALLVVAGVTTLVVVRAHRVLEWVVTAAYVAVALQLLWVVGLLLTGTSVDLVVTVGYLLATIALLPLLGIGRLGDPEAADSDPSRPVLAPDQIARVDGAAAIAVGIALAVASWRITVLLGGGS